MHSSQVFAVLAANGDGSPIVGWLILGGVVWALAAICQAIDKASKKKPPTYEFEAKGTMRPKD